MQMNSLLSSSSIEGYKIEDKLYGNEESSIIEERKNNFHTVFVTNLNINSVLNKF